jgi:hypothetical protein
MSGNQQTQTGLTNEHFEFEAEIEDPQTGLTTTFPMEIDTGNPVALAMPIYCEEFFTEYVTTVHLGGAGSANSPAYAATIKRLGDMTLDYEALAIMTLDNSSDYGLIGIELLKFFEAEIFDSPSSKKLRLEDTYL